MSQKATSQWIKFDPTAVGAEVPIRVRTKNPQDLTATVVINQHGQLLAGSDRHLIEWLPEEMNLAVSEDAAP